MIPKQLDAHGLTAKDLRFEDDAVRRIIADYTREAGLRNLEREIATVCRKAARRHAEGRREPVAVAAADIPKSLGPPKFFREVADRTDTPGVATVPASVPIPAGALFADFPVLANGVGSATITASLNGGTASAQITVTPPEVVALTLTPTTPSAYLGETVAFTATGTMTDGTTQDLTTQVTWTSSDESIATIASTGVASTHAVGSATITATFTASYGTFTASTTLAVLTPPALSLTPASASLKVGQTVAFTVSSATCVRWVDIRACRWS